MLYYTANQYYKSFILTANNCQELHFENGRRDISKTLLLRNPLLLSILTLMALKMMSNIYLNINLLRIK